MVRGPYSTHLLDTEWALYGVASYTCRIVFCFCVGFAPPDGETYYNGVTRHGITGAAAAGVSATGREHHPQR